MRVVLRFGPDISSPKSRGPLEVEYLPSPSSRTAGMERHSAVYKHVLASTYLQYYCVLSLSLSLSNAARCLY